MKTPGSKRRVQASEGGRKIGRSGQRLGNFCWDKRVGWRGRGRGSYPPIFFCLLVAHAGFVLVSFFLAKYTFRRPCRRKSELRDRGDERRAQAFNWYVPFFFTSSAGFLFSFLFGCRNLGLSYSIRQIIIVNVVMSTLIAGRCFP